MTGPSDDDVARGCVWGLLLAAAIWAVVGIIVWWTSRGGPFR